MRFGIHLRRVGTAFIVLGTAYFMGVVCALGEILSGPRDDRWRY